MLFSHVLIAVKLSGKLYSAIMSTGRICPCTRPYKDSANSMNSVGKNLMSIRGRGQSGKIIQTFVTFSILTNLPFKYFEVLLKRCFEYPYSLQIKDINCGLKTLCGSNVSSTHDTSVTTQTYTLLVSLYS